MIVSCHLQLENCLTQVFFVPFGVFFAHQLRTGLQHDIPDTHKALLVKVDLQVGSGTDAILDLEGRQHGLCERILLHPVGTYIL